MRHRPRVPCALLTKLRIVQKEQEQKILRDSAAIEAMVYLQGKIDGVDEGMKKVLLQNAEDMKVILRVLYYCGPVLMISY